MLFGKADINTGYREFLATPNAVLVDVREAEEYAAGHLPEALNIPLPAIETLVVPKDTPVFLYCKRGMRSKKARAALKRLGYPGTKSIGGILDYRGDLAR